MTVITALNLVAYYCSFDRKASIFERDAKTEYLFKEIFIGLHVCRVISTALKITKVYVFGNYVVFRE